MVIKFIYEDEKLGVLSILITDKNEDRIQLLAKVHDYEGKIISEERILIDRINNFVWINDELNVWTTLEKVIRETIIIKQAKEEKDHGKNKGLINND